MSDVIRVGQEALEPVAVTLALSFADDPIWKWIYDSDETLPLDTAIVLGRMLVAGSMPADEIHSTSEHGAVALWTAPNGATPQADEPLRDQQVAPYFESFAAQLGERLALTGQLSAAMKEQRPADPHWYLGMLGTSPDRQNQGLGTQLLQAMQAKADRMGIPTFLESSNPRNYGFYQRHGYTAVDTLAVADSPPLLGFYRAVP